MKGRNQLRNHDGSRQGFRKQGHCNAGWAMFLHPSFLGEGSQPWCLADFYKCCLCLMLMKTSQLPLLLFLVTRSC